MNKKIAKANFNFKHLKKKPKPIPNAKRFKDSGIDEKANFKDNLDETKPVLRDLQSEPKSVFTPLIEGSPDLSAVNINQYVSDDSLNVFTNSSAVSNTLTCTNTCENATFPSATTTTCTNSCLTSTSATTSAISVSTSPVIETETKTNVTSVLSSSSTLSIAQFSTSLNDNSKLFISETDNVNLDVLDEKYNHKTVEEITKFSAGFKDETRSFIAKPGDSNPDSLDMKCDKTIKVKDVIPLGGVGDKRVFLKNTIQNQQLTHILSKLNFTQPLVKFTVLQVNDDDAKAFTFPNCSEPDITSSGLSPTSDNNETTSTTNHLDDSANIVPQQSNTISSHLNCVTSDISSVILPLPVSDDNEILDHSSNVQIHSKRVDTNIISVSFPTSDNNETLDGSANVVNTLGYSDIEKDSLTSLRESDVSVKKSLPRRKKPDLAKLRSKAYDEHGNLNKNQLTLRDFIYFNPPHNPMKMNVFDSSTKSESDTYLESDSEISETEYASPVPHVKVSADGKVIVDPESINICAFDKKLKKMKNCKIIKEDEYSSRLKIMNHIRKQKKDTISSLFCFEEPQKQCRKFWTLEETLKFYKVLNEFGSDFSVMLEAFPYRTRKQLKNKFLAEEKVRIKYIDLAMTKRDSIDFKALEEDLKMKRKRLQKSDKKDKKKLLTTEKKKEFEQRLQVEYKSLVKRKKVTLNSTINFENGVHRLGKIYGEKEKMVRRHIKRMKLKYLEEKSIEKAKSKKNFIKCQDKKNDKCKKSHKRNCRIKFKDEEDSDIESEFESIRFNIGNPLYRNNVLLKQEKLVQTFVDDSFIQDMKDEDDFDLVLSVSSKMYPRLGEDWRKWVRNKVINLLLKKEDCGAKKAAIKMKTDLEEIENNTKFEKSYQLFADPFDYTDPFIKYANDNL